MHLFDDQKDKALEIANHELSKYEEAYHKYFTS
jgi:hypothetical protein